MKNKKRKKKLETSNQHGCLENDMHDNCSTIKGKKEMELMRTKTFPLNDNEHHHAR